MPEYGAMLLKFKESLAGVLDVQHFDFGAASDLTGNLPKVEAAPKRRRFVIDRRWLCFFLEPMCRECGDAVCRDVPRLTFPPKKARRRRSACSPNRIVRSALRSRHRARACARASDLRQTRRVAFDVQTRKKKAADESAALCAQRSGTHSLQPSARTKRSRY